MHDGINGEARNKLDIVQADMVDDPTLQRSKNAICEKCNYNEAIFFQADEVSQSLKRTSLILRVDMLDMPTCSRHHNLISTN